MMRRADGTGAAQTLVRSPFLFAQAFETHDGKWILARRSFFEDGVGRHLRRQEGRLDAGAAGDGPGDGGRARGVAGRSLAGVHLARVRRAGGLRAPLPRCRVGAVAGVHRRRRGSGLVAQRPGAVLSQRERAAHDGGGAPGRHASPSSSRSACSRPRSYVNINPVPSFDVSPDDKRFLFLRETAPNERNELIVVQNWTEEMKARARR